MKKFGTMVLLLGVMASAVSPAFAADKLGEKNKQIVQKFLEETRNAALVEKDMAKVRAVVERYMSDQYIQHDKQMAPGREGYIQGWAPMTKMPNMASFMPKDIYFLGDGDKVVWVSEMKMPDRADPSKTNSSYVFNMVRLENGKLVEHWAGGGGGAGGPGPGPGPGPGAGAGPAPGSALGAPPMTNR